MTIDELATAIGAMEHLIEWAESELEGQENCYQQALRDYSLLCARQEFEQAARGSQAAYDFKDTYAAAEGIVREIEQSRTYLLELKEFRARLLAGEAERSVRQIAKLIRRFPTPPENSD